MTKLRVLVLGFSYFTDNSISFEKTHRWNSGTMPSKFGIAFGGGY